MVAMIKGFRSPNLVRIKLSLTLSSVVAFNLLSRTLKLRETERDGRDPFLRD
jgi:hypothetical protein